MTRFFIFYSFDLSPVISSLLQSATIVALNLAYVRIATRLNDYENHRTVPCPNPIPPLPCLST